jgi:hypothetical protein
MNVDGDWFNELGSKISLTMHGRVITGTYHTAVGAGQGQYKITGYMDSDDDSNNVIGWVVLWNNEQGDTKSLTSWSGQLQQADQEEVITTLWLLTTETDPKSDWKSTYVGQDIFTRIQPSQVEIQKALKKRRPSHPAELLAKSTNSNY